MGLSDILKGKRKKGEVKKGDLEVKIIEDSDGQKCYSKNEKSTLGKNKKVFGTHDKVMGIIKLEGEYLQKARDGEKIGFFRKNGENVYGMHDDVKGFLRTPERKMWLLESKRGKEGTVWIATWKQCIEGTVA